MTTKNPPDGGHNPLLRKFVNGKEAAKVADVIAKLTATQAFAAFILRDIGRRLVIFIRGSRTVITALITAIGPGAGVGQHGTSRKNSTIRFRRRGQYKSCLLYTSGSRVVSQEISTADEGDGGQVVVIGR